MIVLNSEGGRSKYPLKEYLIESEDDVEQLPLDVPIGSCALDMTTGVLYFLITADGTESGTMWNPMNSEGGGGGGGGGGGDITMHNQLNGRDSAGAHPMSAITGLVAELAKKYEKPLAGIPKEDLTQAVQDVINTALTSTDPRVAQWSAKYDKPAGGIPKSDLVSTVQDSLTKADTSVQKVNTIGPDTTGNVTLTKANIGLGNVDNTSDANKPISTAQQAAFDAEKTRAETAEAAEKARATAAEATLETAITTEKTRATAAETALDSALTAEKTRAQTEEGKKVDKTTTINGKALSSNVTLSKSDIGLDKVDNTKDIDKPVSTAQ